ncbi:Nuclear receptor-binding protein [Halocaridina rubra]|uniref:Nuclear receptor-binding protein n=1 Tax=Halocaridina rubra TaxID=373956 RepID=A0AAN8XF03_HALRR
MTGSKNGNEPEAKSPRESGEDSEDESEILEESPCGRWSKRRQEFPKKKIKQFTIPAHVHHSKTKILVKDID